MTFPSPTLSNDPTLLPELEDILRSLAPDDWAHHPIYVVTPADVLVEACEVWAYVATAVDLLARDALAGC